MWYAVWCVFGRVVADSWKIFRLLSAQYGVAITHTCVTTHNSVVRAGNSQCSTTDTDTDAGRADVRRRLKESGRDYMTALECDEAGQRGRLTLR